MKTTLPPSAATPRGTAGKIGWAILWLLGVPLPVLLLLYACSGHQ